MRGERNVPFMVFAAGSFQAFQSVRAGRVQHVLGAVCDVRPRAAVPAADGPEVPQVCVSGTRPDGMGRRECRSGAEQPRALQGTPAR